MVLIMINNKKMKNETINLRATFFLNFDLHEEDIEKMRSALSFETKFQAQHQYNSLMKKLQDGTTLPVTKLFLNLVSEDGAIVITFTADRIDYVYNKMSEDHHLPQLADFVRNAIVMCTKICDLFNVNLSRIALGKIVAFDFDTDTLNNVCKKFAPDLNKNMVEWALRRVYRIPKNGDSLEMNVVSELSRNLFGIKYEEAPKDRFVIYYDLNTSNIDPSIKINNANIVKFWENSEKEMRELADSYNLIILGNDE